MKKQITGRVVGVANPGGMARISIQTENAGVVRVQTDDRSRLKAGDHVRVLAAQDAVGALFASASAVTPLG